MNDNDESATPMRWSLPTMYTDIVAKLLMPLLQHSSSPNAIVRVLLMSFKVSSSWFLFFFF